MRVGMRAGPSPDLEPCSGCACSQDGHMFLEAGAVPARLAAQWPGKPAKVHRDRCAVWPMTGTLLCAFMTSSLTPEERTTHERVKLA